MKSPFTTGHGTYGVRAFDRFSQSGAGPPGASGSSTAEYRDPLPSPFTHTSRLPARTGDATDRRAISPSRHGVTHFQFTAPVSGSYPAAPAVLYTTSSGLPSFRGRTTGVE